MEFKIYIPETAPIESRPLLEDFKKKAGNIPNLLGVFAEAPAVLKSYSALEEFFAQTSLTETERHVVFLTASCENRCPYCVAAHSVRAKRRRVPEEIINAIRNGTPVPDAKLESLRRFTALVVKNRGELSDEDVSKFLVSGYTQQHVLEVIVGVALKVLTTYTNHIAHPALDKAFASQEWKLP
jgi:AhpD family alkylhydroperoxidase